MQRDPLNNIHIQSEQVMITPAQLKEVPLTLPVMSVQDAPLSSEPHTVSEAPRDALSVAVMVWAATLVMKSLALAPLSLLNARLPNVVVGPEVSST